MKVVILISRILLGLVFLVFGSNLVHTWMNSPMPTGDAGTYFGILYTHHALVAIGLIQVLGGLMLLVGRYVPLGIVLLSAVLYNIWIYHLLILGGQYPLPLGVTVLMAILLYGYRGSLAGIFSASAQPSV